MSQLDLSAIVQRSQGVVSEWERGQRRPGISDIWSLAEALACRIEDLVGPPRTPDELRYYDDRMKRIQRADTE